MKYAPLLCLLPLTACNPETREKNSRAVGEAIGTLSHDAAKTSETVLRSAHEEAKKRREAEKRAKYDGFPGHYDK